MYVFATSGVRRCLNKRRCEIESETSGICARKDQRCETQRTGQTDYAAVTPVARVVTTGHLAGGAGPIDDTTTLLTSLAITGLARHADLSPVVPRLTYDLLVSQSALPDARCIFVWIRVVGVVFVQVESKVVLRRQLSL